MTNLVAVLRIIAYLVFSFFVLELAIPTEGSLAIEEHPVLWAVLTVILFFAIVFEIIVEAIKRVLVRSLENGTRARYYAMEAMREEGRRNWLKRLMGSKPLTKEQEIVLDHEYDGIRELDNILPPWWVYLFWGTIIFAVIYLVRYEVMGGANQYQELEQELIVAEQQIAEYKKNNQDLIDADNVVLLTDASDLSAGKSIYVENCVACHKDSGGGGIGPNLTDDYWILGGGIKNIYHTISEGGRPGKGMIAWKSELKPVEMAQVASYVMSLHGSNPADGKEPEGDLWTDESAEAQIE
ncbi:MAG TPA: cbb3-type cytochrome c oxidase N-terminal domain-containing protein [Flavobacteriaceae bacterium]|nr:cbb3-type cytochrome c oxidase N-terminal domain-containing protein [Flavobacteriaceae bacterium]